ncbi:MAG: uncharacterized protein KVP18_004210, partial [Porospora cf. gigantea A]|uniref:uncharacterized protein n=1 Tax=Porospora cf. gigantea A TaxID=2853593 RepID=UPI00355ACA9D
PDDTRASSERMLKIIQESVNHDKQRFAAVMTILESLKRLGLNITAETLLDEVRGLQPAALADEATKRDADAGGNMQLWLSKQLGPAPPQEATSTRAPLAEETNLLVSSEDQYTRFMHWTQAAVSPCRYELCEVGFGVLLELWLRMVLRAPTVASSFLLKNLDNHVNHQADLRSLESFSRLGGKPQSHPLVRHLLTGKPLLLSLSDFSVQLMTSFLIVNRFYSITEIVQRRLQITVYDFKLAHPGQRLLHPITLDTDAFISEEKRMAQQAGLVSPPHFELSNRDDAYRNPLLWGLQPENITESKAVVLGYDPEALLARIPEPFRSKKFSLRFDGEQTNSERAPRAPAVPEPEPNSLHAFVWRKLSLRNISRRFYPSRLQWPSAVAYTVQHAYEDVTSVAFERLSGNGSLVAVGLSDNSLQIWDLLGSEAARVLDVLDRRLRLLDPSVLDDEPVLRSLTVSDGRAHDADNYEHVQDSSFTVAEMVNSLTAPVQFEQLTQTTAPVDDKMLAESLAPHLESIAAQCSASVLTENTTMILPPFVDEPLDVTAEFFGVPPPLDTLSMQQVHSNIPGVTASLRMRSLPTPACALAWCGSDVDVDRLAGQALLAGGADGVIRLYGFGEQDADTAPPKVMPSTVDMSTFLDGPRQFTCPEPVAMHLANYACHAGAVWSIKAFEPYGGYFTSGGMDGTVRVWALDRSVPVRVLTSQAEDAYAVTNHPNRSYVAGSMHDRAIRIWDLRDPGTPQVLLGSARPPTKIEFSPNGVALAAGGADGTTNIWDLRALQACVGSFTRPSPVTGLAWSYGSALIGSSYEDGTVSVTDLTEILNLISKTDVRVDSRMAPLWV